MGAGGTASYIYSAAGDSQDQFIAGGGLGQLGVGYTLGPGELLLKARYSYGGLEQPFGGLAVMAGYAFGIF